MKAKGKVTFAVAALLLAVFTAMFAGEAAAAKRPDWVGVKYTGWSLQKQKKTKITDSNHLRLVLKFDIINNSRDGRIMTAIFDRTISWKGVLQTLFPDSDINKAGLMYSHSFQVEYSMKGTEPYKGEWYPGEVYKYEHSVPLKTIISKPRWNWKETNEALLRKDTKFRLEKYNLDFQVRSKK